MKIQKNKKPKPYCTNKEMLAELICFNETDVLSEELGIMFMDIATRFAHRGDWNGYEFHQIEDFVSEAVMRMISQVDKFDVNRYSYKTDGMVRNEETGQDELGKITVGLSIKEHATTDINDVTYKRVESMLINVKDEDDIIKLSPPNPFAYFSQIVYHKFIMEAKKHYKQLNIQKEMCERYIEELECNAHLDSGGLLKKLLEERTTN